MTREEAIRRIKDHMVHHGIGGFPHILLAEAMKMAIGALREQEERSKGCEYCQMFDDPCGVPMIASEEDDCDRGIYLYNGYLCANGGSFCDAKVKFCPMCGRKLEVER